MENGAEKLSEWVEKYTGELLSWAIHKISDAELAKDLVQDTFLAAAEKYREFRGESSSKTWLFSILNYKIIDVYRKKVKQSVSFDENNLPGYFDEEGSWKDEARPRQWHEEEEHLLDNIEFQAVLKKCLEILPEKWNACLRLKYIMNKNGAEICQELGILPTNFWQIVHRAKMQMRDCIENKWFKN